MTSGRVSDALTSMPVVAIVRGVRPNEAVDIGAAIHESGIGIVEVPLNSPEPFDSIRRLSASLGDNCVVGAGTVLDTAAVERVAEAGGDIVVAPNTDPAVIRRSLELGMIPVPGWATPSDAFTAYASGARLLKLFPAATYGPGHLRAVRAVLPADGAVLAVGGIGAGDLGDWWAAGVDGFGIGSDIYKPGMSADDVAQRAATVVSAVRALGDRG